MTVHTALGAARLTGRATSGLTAYVWAWRSFTVPFALFLVWAYILVPAWGPAAWVLLAAGFLLGFASMMDHGSGFSLDAFVQEVALARIVGGVHYRHSTEVGQAMGQRIGEWALHRSLAGAH